MMMMMDGPDNRISLLLGSSFGWASMGSVGIVGVCMAGGNWFDCWYRHTGVLFVSSQAPPPPPPTTYHCTTANLLFSSVVDV